MNRSSVGSGGTPSRDVPPHVESRVPPLLVGDVHDLCGVVVANHRTSVFDDRLAIEAARVGLLQPLLLELGEAGRRQIACLDEARAMFDGDEDIVRQLVDVFLRDHERTVVELQRASSAMDYAQLAEIGHAVKGSVGLFSANRAVEAARKLESLARASDPEAATSQARILISELGLLARVLRNDSA